MTLSYACVSQHRKMTLPFVQEAALIIGLSLFLGLWGHVRIPLPFTPVPLATQPHVILFLAACLGSRRATLATAGLLVQCAFGLPVFAGSQAGIAYLCGPTGGYILGYLLAAYLTGRIVESSQTKTPTNIFLAMGAGNILIFASGALWLATFIGWKSALVLGVLPFLIGDLCKTLACVQGWKSLLRHAR